PTAPPTAVPPTPAPTTATPIPTSPPGGAGAVTATLVGAGDVASCSSTGDEATAALLGAIPGTIFLAGDGAYESGSAVEYANCFDPSWGAYKSRIKPTPGNHEYVTSGASGYFGYFGAAAGDPAKGYYAYSLGGWRIYALNSNCSAVSGCGAGSAQEQWLRADLAAHPTSCAAAYWHHPLFSSGEHGNQSAVRPLWQALQDAGAEIILNGHDHDYERFAAQTATGSASASGIVEYVVGTGGKSHYAFGSIVANSVARNATTSGVLKLTLRQNGWDWGFVPVAGASYSDSGSAVCH
ncbi:MAG: metallophosphoesterase, partial [Chloroflexota bacterium]